MSAEQIFKDNPAITLPEFQERTQLSERSYYNYKKKYANAQPGPAAGSKEDKPATREQETTRNTTQKPKAKPVRILALLRDIKLLDIIISAETVSAAYALWLIFNVGAIPVLFFLVGWMEWCRRTMRKPFRIVWADPQSKEYADAKAYNDELQHRKQFAARTSLLVTCTFFAVNWKMLYTVIAGVSPTYCTDMLYGSISVASVSAFWFAALMAAGSQYALTGLNMNHNK